MIDINLNLAPGEELEERSLGKFLTWVLTYGRYIIIGTEIIVLLAFLARFRLDQEITDLHQAINQKQAYIIASQSLENDVRTMQNHLSLIKRLNQQRSIPQKLLTAFEETTPQDVTLTNLNFGISALSLTATSLTNEGFKIFLNNLSVSPYFSDISIDGVNKGRNSGIDFKLSMVLKNF